VKLSSLLEDRYADRWARELATKNRAKIAKEREEIEKASAVIEKKPPKPKKPTSSEIYNKVVTVIGNTFPDGDPIDWLIPYMKRTGVTREEIDAAVRKHALIKRGGLYTYLASMWDDFQGDTISDAKAALADKRMRDVDEHSPFYNVIDGKIEPTENPWK